MTWNTYQCFGPLTASPSSIHEEPAGSNGRGDSPPHQVELTSVAERQAQAGIDEVCGWELGIRGDPRGQVARGQLATRAGSGARSLLETRPRSAPSSRAARARVSPCRHRIRSQPRREDGRAVPRSARTASRRRTTRGAAVLRQRGRTPPIRSPRLSPTRRSRSNRRPPACKAETVRPNCFRSVPTTSRNPSIHGSEAVRSSRGRKRTEGRLRSFP